MLIRKKISPLIIVILILITGAFLLYHWCILQFNHPDAETYPVQGVDVSTYQGAIDWPVLADNGLTFAFIKATEGSSFQDENFKYNWENAGKTHLKVGAYHFFSYETSGATQAENYIKTVPVKDDALPPVVDIEFYGSYTRYTAPDKETTRRELTELLNRLESHYGKRPIIYTSTKPYATYIADYYNDYPIWIRNFYACPILSDHRQWTFWQYSDKGSLSGYTGYAPNIDLNVYRGSYDEFMAQFGY